MRPTFICWQHKPRDVWGDMMIDFGVRSCAQLSSTVTRPFVAISGSFLHVPYYSVVLGGVILFWARFRLWHMWIRVYNSWDLLRNVIMLQLSAFAQIAVRRPLKNFQGTFPPKSSYKDYHTRFYLSITQLSYTCLLLDNLFISESFSMRFPHCTH